MAPPPPSGQARKKPKKHGGRAAAVAGLSRKSAQEAREIAALEGVLQGEAPPPGSNPLSATDGYAAARVFDALPLSEYTKDGLRRAKFVTLTAVQRACLPHALAGRDILGAAKTGSGKTLAFLVPVGAGAGGCQHTAACMG